MAFTCPRKDVCIEIHSRLKEVYPNVLMSLVYGGHTSSLNGQLIVLTTHQLFHTIVWHFHFAIFRYKKYFDLLILDEADAFPYYKNDFLETFLNDSVKGAIIYLSATITSYFTKRCKNIVCVNRRFHNHDLPVPKFIKYFFFNKIKVLNETINEVKNKQLLIFVPTIAIGNKLAKKIKIPFIYSSSIDKNKYIVSFKERKIKKLITTSILERGITFFDVQVIVYEADNTLFDEASLTQIAGRVGRKIKATTGKVFFLASKKTTAIANCIKTIIKKNKYE